MLPTLQTSVPPPNAAVRSSFELLELVDALPADATGELVLRDASASIVGVIFVEARRVCWVAARGFAGRLSDLLRARTSPRLEPRAMEEIYRRCQRENRRLGEHLVTERFLEASDLREALSRHSIECLQTLGDTRVVGSFSPRAAGVYAADFTFATGDLAVAVGALSHGVRSETLREELARYEPSFGAGFLRDPSLAHPLPLAVVGEPVSTRMLLRLGRWASAELDLAGALDAPNRTATFADDRKGGVVLWAEDDALYVAVFANQIHFSRAVSRRAAPRSS